ncbi:helix-turn-helix transcriptional regulator [Flavobacterium sp. I3-2]|uniref:helix-turn-helix transcriptional regulator n=1 Tax=Flavobacterium sp. I3-2 TaxID=2748319 RepID=UPI0015B1F47D|nr:AraC family transcriptional regulator [Flavobacterium sp. I3-2]
MKEFTVSKKRWNYLIDALIDLGNGKLDQQVFIQNTGDEFECLEVLFNLVNEEWRERLLHLSFIKPNEFQKYINQYAIIVNKDFKINNVSEDFITSQSLCFKDIKNLNFLDLIDQETAEYLKDCIQKNIDFTKLSKQTLILFDQNYMFNIRGLNDDKTLVINLYQMYLDTKHFKSLITENFDINRLKERRRNEFIIEDIKVYIDHYPLNKKLTLNQICKKFGVNSNQLKKLFKEQYQTSVYEYFISLRMKHAYILIETSTLAFKEIAVMVGYPQYSPFVNYFKSYFNTLPKEVRFNLKNSHQK